ncbi:MAG: DUF917 domain-containing protein [Candidatus Hodarchaeota archaeon]
MERLSREAVNHYITGAKVLACGGGGSEATAHQRINEVYDAGDSFQMVSLQEVPDDELLFIVGTVGGGISQEAKQLVAQLPRAPTDLYVDAAQRLTEYLGCEPFGFIASEIGPGNGVVPMYVAAKLGKVVIDADCCGRAKPEIAISTTNLAGLAITPLSMVSPYGDFMILKDAVDDARAEVITRHVAIASGGTVGVARCPATGKQYRHAAIDGSITRCISLGRVIVESREKGENVIERILAFTSGLTLFTGRITRLQLVEEGGFTTGTVEFSGVLQAGEMQGQEVTLRIWFKNEYLAVWYNNTPLGTSPDSICVIDAITGEGVPITREELRNHREVSIIGIPAAPQWHTPQGLELFGPTHFQLPTKYTPFPK